MFIYFFILYFILFYYSNFYVYLHVLDILDSYRGLF